MDKINKVFDELYWFLDAVFGVLEQLFMDALTVIAEIFKIVFYFGVCFPIIVLYRWLTRKEYEQ